MLHSRNTLKRVVVFGHCSGAMRPIRPDQTGSLCCRARPPLSGARLSESRDQGQQPTGSIEGQLQTNLPPSLSPKTPNSTSTPLHDPHPRSTISIRLPPLRLHLLLALLFSSPSPSSSPDPRCNEDFPQSPHLCQQVQQVQQFLLATSLTRAQHLRHFHPLRPSRSRLPRASCIRAAE
jgi:hypothetical protein